MGRFSTSSARHFAQYEEHGTLPCWPFSLRQEQGVGKGPGIGKGPGQARLRETHWMGQDMESLDTGKGGGLARARRLQHKEL